MIDMTNESWAGPSATDRALYAHLTNHIETERGLLESIPISPTERSPERFAIL